MSTNLSAAPDLGECPEFGATLPPRCVEANDRSPPEPTFGAVTKRQILTVRLEAMPPKDFEPADDQRGRDDCCPEHDAKRGERLLPARREPGQ